MIYQFHLATFLCNYLSPSSSPCLSCLSLPSCSSSYPFFLSTSPLSIYILLTFFLLLLIPPYLPSHLCLSFFSPFFSSVVKVPEIPHWIFNATHSIINDSDQAACWISSNPSGITKLQIYSLWTTYFSWPNPNIHCNQSFFIFAYLSIIDATYT